MWNALKTIFGGADTASKAMDIAGDSIRGIGNWIDEKDYTQEEKAIASAKMVDAHLSLIKATAGENSARSVNRRWLAWGICGFVVFWGSITMIFAMMGKLEIVNNMINVMSALWMGQSFVAVVGFYFGVQMFRK